MNWQVMILSMNNRIWKKNAGRFLSPVNSIVEFFGRFSFLFCFIFFFTWGNNRPGRWRWRARLFSSGSLVPWLGAFGNWFFFFNFWKGGLRGLGSSHGGLQQRNVYFDWSMIILVHIKGFDADQEDPIKHRFLSYCCCD